MIRVSAKMGKFKTIEGRGHRMNRLSNYHRHLGVSVVVMRLVLACLVSLCSAWTQAQVPAHVSKRCVSESGKSIYDIELNVLDKTGEIRYRFMGQDVFYSVHIEMATPELIYGIATWRESRSGETKGKPFSFTYNVQKEVLKELETTATYH